MAIPVTTTQTIGKSADGSACYRLSYNPATKKVMGLKYGNVITMANLPVVLFSADTYAAVQAEAASLGLAGLPAQVAGQP